MARAIRTFALPVRHAASALRAFLRSEAGGGIVLIVAAAAALIVANCATTAGLYAGALHLRAGPLDVHGWIDDAAMALFFLLVGLEIKRELIDGALAHPAARRLPVIAALGGMAVPAFVYLAVVRGNPALVRGWAIPAATDIAFAIGVMALLGRRVPVSLKLFLTTVAIVDDMGAVAIIALAYTAQIHWLALAAAGAILGSLALLARARVQALWPYLAGGIVLWIAVFASGVHATVAGVALAAVIPIRRSPGAPDDAQSPLHRLEHGLAPWVGYLIVPLFGFANAGVPLAGVGWRDLLAPLPLGVAAGLVIGKQAGVFASVRIAVALGFARRPKGADWWQLYGVALLAGIGFTMSLFIGGLAFGDAARGDAVRIGVLAGSCLSALAGAAVLALAARAHEPRLADRNDIL